MDEVKLMTQAGEKVGHAVGSSIKAVRESAAAAGRTSGATRKATKQAENRLSDQLRNSYMAMSENGQRMLPDGSRRAMTDMVAEVDVAGRRVRREVMRQQKRIAKQNKRMAKQARRAAKHAPDLFSQVRSERPRRRGRFMLLLTVFAGAAAVAAYMARSRRRVDGMRLAEEPPPRYDGQYREDEQVRDDDSRIPRLREAQTTVERSSSHQR